MKEVSGEEQDRYEKARSAVLEGVSPSLWPLLFQFFDQSGQPTARHFQLDWMARNAALVCKLAGLLLQASWCIFKGRKEGDEVPGEIDHILLQVWAGHQRYTEGLALSLLQEAALVPARSPYTELVRNGPEIFVRWRNLLNAKSRRYKEYLNEIRTLDLHDVFADLIVALPVLRNTKLEDGQFHLPLGTVGVFPFVYRPLNRTRTLFLFGFETVDANPTVVFEDPFSDYIEDIPLEPGSKEFEQYSLIRQALGFQNVKRGVLYLFGSGYEHVRNLAQAIAKSPRAVLEHLNRGSDSETGGLVSEDRAEDFVTMLLAERGPTAVLERIFNGHIEQFDHYLEFLGNRGEANEAQLRSLYDAEIRRKKASIQGYLDLDPTLRDEVMHRLEIETRCWCVLKAAGLQLEPTGEYVESIGMLTRMLREFYHNTESNVVSTGINIGKLIERTFRFLTCFYTGLQSYYGSYKEDTANYERHETAMIKAASRAYQELRLFSPGPLVQRFREICESMQGEAIFNLLGRRSVCDKKSLKHLVADDWISVLNRLKHDPLTNPRPPVTRDELKQFAERAMALFRFLSYGREHHSDFAELSESEPVYPQVVSFREVHRKRDGLVIYNYELHSLHDLQKPPAVNILTPREYVPNQQYYCIPVKARSTKNWWLDPFLVRCQPFDAIFREIPANNRAKADRRKHD